MIFLYLMATVVANIMVTSFGPSVLPITAFLLIPFDMVARDYLHSRWKGKDHFFLKMAGLILAGSALSFLVNFNSLNVAIASFVAFLVAGAVDTLVFEILYKRDYLIKVNLSNWWSAVTDSIIFPLVAFSMVDLKLSMYQTLSKFIGGVLWSIVIKKFIRKGL